MNTTRELNKWRLGELLMLEAQRLPSEQTVDRLQELYAQFGYPSDMRLVSRYRASQWAFDHGRADREDLTIGPLEAMRRVIHSLGADLGVQPDLIEDTLK